MKQIIIVFSFLIFISCSSEIKTNLIADSDNGGLILPKGFSSFVVADNIGRARHIAVRDNGDLYVSLNRTNNGGGLACLHDEDGDGRMDTIVYHGKFDGTGVEIYNNHIYFGADTIVVRYKLTDGLVPEESYEVIAEGFVNQRQHAAKPLAFDGEGNMYVTVGAPSNACMEQSRTKGSPGMKPCPLLERHGGIWQFKADKLNQDQVKDGYRYATGIRHAVAIRWNRAVNKLYGLQHGRDQLHQFFPNLYDEKHGAELPAEEFLMIQDGSDFGWPYCYFDPFQNKKVLGPEYGGDGKIIDECEAKDDPLIGFPAHMAPNDLLFYTGNMFPKKYKDGAFIAFHGSWNRAPLPQEGYYVVFIPMENGLPSGKWEVFADGFSGKDVVTSPREAEHRPCGLAEGPDGSLYVTDDVKGRVWRIFYN